MLYDIEPYKILYIIDKVFLSDCANEIHIFRYTNLDFYRTKLSENRNKSECALWIANTIRIILNYYNLYK